MIVFVATVTSCISRIPSDDDSFVELFSIPFGISEHLLFYYNHPTATPFNRSAIDMRGGVFTLLNGLTNKINRYTSYGELILSLYDPERSGTTTIPSEIDSTQAIVSRYVRPYPFNAIYDVTVSTQGVFYIADDVPEAQITYDEELESALRTQVIRYDSRNDSTVTLGQEGLGGIPFPHIEDLHIVNENQLVVVCDIDDTWLVFWYSSDGRLLYEVAFPPTAIPALITDSDAIEIETIIPDPNILRLYIKVNYYNQQSETVSRLYWLDLPEGIYQEYVELPRYANDQQYQPPMHFLGLVNQQQLVFYSFVSDGDVEITVIGLDGSVILKRTVALSEEPMLFAEFSLSPEGVISVFAGHEERTRVLWWRLDQELL